MSGKPIVTAEVVGTQNDVGNLDERKKKVKEILWTLFCY